MKTDVSDVVYRIHMNVNPREDRWCKIIFFPRERYQEKFPRGRTLTKKGAAPEGGDRAKEEKLVWLLEVSELVPQPGYFS